MRRFFTRLLQRFRQIRFRPRGFRARWNELKDNGDAIFQAAWRLSLLLLLVALVVFVLKGLREDGYTITALQAPAAFVDAGFSGAVLSKKLIDELNEVNQFVSSQKTDILAGIQSDVDRPDLDVQVMGIGLTLNSVTYHLRELLGRDNRTIGGELTDLDQTLSLTLRMTGYPPKTFSYPYEEDRRFEALEELLHRAARQIIQNLDPYRIAVYHYKKKEIDESLEVINGVFSQRPEESAWAYVAWGNLLNQQGKSEAAIDKFKLATEVDPTLELAWSNWAWTEYRLGNTEKALSIFQRLVKLNPNSGGHWNSIAMCHRQLQQYEEAEKAYQQAVKADPHTSWWYGNWADFKAQQGDTAAVRSIFEKMLLNLELKGKDYYLAWGMYHILMQRPEQGLPYLENALELDPNDIDALQAIIRFKHRLGRDFSQIIEYSKRLLPMAELQSNTSPALFRQTYYNYLAMAEYQLEEYDSAMVHVQLAIEQDTSVAYPYTTMAEIYGLRGNDEGFYRALEIALQKGYRYFDDIVGQEPYRRYAGEERFQRLVEQYGRKSSALVENPGAK